MALIEIPEDRVYDVKMLITPNPDGGLSLDLFDKTTGDTKVEVYLSVKELIEVLNFINENTDSVKEKRQRGDVETAM